MRLHVLRRHVLAGVAPAPVDVAQHRGDVLVGEGPRGHDPVVRLPVHGHRTLEPTRHRPDRAHLVAVQVVAAGQRRERPRDAPPPGLVAGRAVGAVHGPSPGAPPPLRLCPRPEPPPGLPPPRPLPAPSGRLPSSGISPEYRSLLSVPSPLSIPSAPLLNARVSEWSTRM